MMVGENTKFGVDIEALKRAGSPGDHQVDQLAALRAELDTLNESVASVTATARGLAKTSANVMAIDVEDYLKRIFASVGIAWFVGYLWGRSR